MTDYAIGVDLGGTNLRAAAVSRDGKMLNKVASSTPVGAGRNAVISDMVVSIEELQAGLPGQKLAGVEPAILFSILPSRLTAAARKLVPPRSTPIA